MIDIYRAVCNAAYALIVFAAALSMVVCALFTLFCHIGFWKSQAKWLKKGEVDDEQLS